MLQPDVRVPENEGRLLQGDFDSAAFDIPGAGPVGIVFQPLQRSGSSALPVIPEAHLIRWKVVDWI